MSLKIEKQSEGTKDTVLSVLILVMKHILINGLFSSDISTAATQSLNN